MHIHSIIFFLFNLQNLKSWSIPSFLHLRWMIFKVLFFSIFNIFFDFIYLFVSLFYFLLVFFFLRFLHFWSISFIFHYILSCYITLHSLPLFLYFTILSKYLVCFQDDSFTMFVFFNITYYFQFIFLLPVI